MYEHEQNLDFDPFDLLHVLPLTAKYSRISCMYSHILLPRHKVTQFLDHEFISLSRLKSTEMFHNIHDI